MNGAEQQDTSTAWRVHGEQDLYTSPWLRLGLADVELPDGRRFDHHVLTLRPGALVAPVDPAGSRVLLMWRHRFVSDVWTWEVPGGLVDDGEDPATTAARELLEETGVRAERLEHVATYQPFIGLARGAQHVYLGHGAVQVAEPTETTEMQRMEWLPLDDVPALLRSGQVHHPATHLALLHLLAARAGALG